MLIDSLSYIVQRAPKDIGGSASIRRAPSVNHLQRSPAEKMFNQPGNTKFYSRQFSSLSTCLLFLPLIPAIELHHKHSLFWPPYFKAKAWSRPTQKPSSALMYSTPTPDPPPDGNQSAWGSNLVYWIWTVYQWYLCTGAGSEKTLWTK